MRLFCDVIVFVLLKITIGCFPLLAAVASHSLSALCGFHALRAYCENHKALQESAGKVSNRVALDF